MEIFLDVVAYLFTYIMVSVPFLRNVPIFTLKYNYSQICGILLSKLQALYVCTLASIPGRVFAFITVRRTTRPGTSCLRMRQILMYNDP